MHVGGAQRLGRVLVDGRLLGRGGYGPRVVGIPPGMQNLDGKPRMLRRKGGGQQRGRTPRRTTRSTLRAVPRTRGAACSLCSRQHRFRSLLTRHIIVTSYLHADLAVVLVHRIRHFFMSSAGRYGEADSAQRGPAKRRGGGPGVHGWELRRGWRREFIAVNTREFRITKH